MKIPARYVITGALLLADVVRAGVEALIKAIKKPVKYVEVQCDNCGRPYPYAVKLNNRCPACGSDRRHQV